MPARRWIFQSIFWGGYAGLSLLLIAQFGPLTSGVILIMALVAIGLFVASEILRKLVLKRGWADLPAWPLAWRILVFVPFCAAVIQAIIFVVVKATLSLGWITMPASGADYRLSAALGYVFNTSIMLWLWSAVWLTWYSVRRFRQGEIAKWRAEAVQNKLELEVLKAQLNPHFIFNALNNLRAMINEDKDKARDMVTQLSNLLRHTLYHSRRDRVTVTDEMLVVRDYIALEQLHYEDCLQVEWQQAGAGNETGDATLPPMLLQLLVENAVKHGIAKTVGGGLITIALSREDNRLHICVTSPGQWAPGSDPGIGLTNLQQRLLHVSGAGAACNIDAKDNRVRVSMEIPQ